MKVRIINTIIWSILGILIISAFIGLLLLVLYKPLFIIPTILLIFSILFGLSFSKTHPIYKSK